MSAVAESPRPVLRPLREHDLKRVHEIESRSYDFPWSLGVFSDCLRVGYCCWAVVDQHDLAGYGIMTIAAQECHILNVCVDPDYRRRGYAAALLQKLIESACARGAKTAFLEVRPSNGAALDLYLRAGFSRLGERTDYYSALDGRENAVVLYKTLADND